MGLSVRDVSFHYGQNLVLDAISLDVDTGVTGVVGANGAGKTTLLKLVAGILRPDVGSITISSGQHVGARIGYLPQNPSATPLLSAQAYVEYFAYLAGVPHRSMGGATSSALDEVGLIDQARTRTSRLSGGMFRRLALAAALVGKPDVLLLDEPTVGLDPVQRVRFRSLIGDLADNRIVLVASHILEDITPIASRVIVLNGTVKVFDGTVGELAEKGPSAASAGIQPSIEAAFMAMLNDDEAETRG